MVSTAYPSPGVFKITGCCNEVLAESETGNSCITCGETLCQGETRCLSLCRCNRTVSGALRTVWDRFSQRVYRAAIGV